MKPFAVKLFIKGSSHNDWSMQFNLQGRPIHNLLAHIVVSQFDSALQ